MRKIASLVVLFALAACSGGGGGGTQYVNPVGPATPTPTATPIVQSGYVSPQFTIVIPSGTASGARKPSYISSATLSVQITLTADSAGITPGTLSGNPATTAIPAGTCNTGCTVSGPPSPPGTDSFTLVTYDNAVPASGHPLNAGQVNNVTIAVGQNNSETVTLGAIPKTLSITGVPTGGGALTAGTATQSASISVVAVDGAGNTIPTGHTPNIFYVDALGNPINVTVSDPDAGAHGSCVVNTGTSTCTTGAATSVTFSGPDITRVFAYDGLAENPVTLTASASTATSATASFQPVLNAPVFNGSQATPAGVAQSGSAEIDLFAPSGFGSTGSESFTESGWTNSPYNHALFYSSTGACTSGAGLATSMSQIASIVFGTNSTTNGTPFTAAAISSPTAGSCPTKISDGLSGNTTDGSTTLTVTYTTTTINGSSGHRRTK